VEVIRKNKFNPEIAQSRNPSYYYFTNPFYSCVIYSFLVSRITTANQQSIAEESRQPSRGTNNSNSSKQQQTAAAVAVAAAVQQPLLFLNQ
jgi:hypothetical protein